MCEITKQLEIILDPNNPEDKKLLLLTKLFESRFDQLLKNDVSIEGKVEELSNKFQSYEKTRDSCPVYVNKQHSQFIAFILRYPRFVIISLLCLGYTIGTFGFDLLLKLL